MSSRADFEGFFLPWQTEFVKNRGQSRFHERIQEKIGLPCNIAGIRVTLYKTNCLELTATILSPDVLVEQCIRGDKTAYRLLYERYARAMYNTAYRITNNTADAEDILQEAFIDAFLQISSFRQQSTFGAWIKQIVVFKSISLIKKRRLLLVELEPEKVELSEEQGPDEEAIEFNVNAIKQALQTLPDGYRAVLTLYLLEGYDQEEIANIMQVAPSTVRTQYIRGKQKLIALLKKRENV